MKNPTMHFSSFQEMLDFINGSVAPQELKEYKEPEKPKPKAKKKAKKKEE